MSPSAPGSNAEKENKDKVASIVTQSFPPSHILQDGRFIHLPPPNLFERSKFFERAIAKHGLLEADMTTTAKEQQQKAKAEEEEEEEKAKEAAPKVHPLAIASARLQAAGIAELNRAINLSTLVNTGEYFGLTNIVDPSLELGAAAAAAAKEGAATVPTPSTQGSTQGDAAAHQAPSSSTNEAPSAAAATSAAAPAPASHPNAALNEKEMKKEQRVKSAYVLKRKRAIFDKASRVLQRHESRLKAAIVAQTIPDQRLRQLRPQWRLVAPEHGTRAKPHAVRPTEVVAIDVDVYDPTGGSSAGGNSLVGRLASKVPRYATIELTDQYNVQDEVRKQRIKEESDEEENEGAKPDDTREEDAMEIDDPEEDKSTKKIKKESGVNETESVKTEAKLNQEKHSQFTRAEPFAIADPTLGKISTDFDPNKVSFLTLQFDIEKPSTGFCMSSCLEPIATTTVEKAKENEKKKDGVGVGVDSQKVKKEQEEETGEENKDNGGDNSKSNSASPDDEQVLVALQHSLFCAKLFESIRKELMGDDSVEDGHRNHTLQENQRQQPVAWLSSESEENFLPPPSLMVRSTTNSSGAELCVIHCHASEVKVQLDNEYTLRAKLVEADEQSKNPKPDKDEPSINQSGSQTPQQLHLLCRSLLLHAQEVYHNHSLHESFVAAEKQRREEEQKQEAHKPKGLDRVQKKDLKTLPKILQSCVGLGTKMLFEQRIRKALVRVRKWLKATYKDCQDTLKTEWLSLSLFDLHSHFSLSFGAALTIDVTIVRDEMTVTSYGSAGRTEGSNGEYRKVKFHSDTEFEVFLRLELRRLLRNQP